MKYKVTAYVKGKVELGEFEAPSKDDAINMALAVEGLDGIISHLSEDDTLFVVNTKAHKI